MKEQKTRRIERNKEVARQSSQRSINDDGYDSAQEFFIKQKEEFKKKKTEKKKKSKTFSYAKTRRKRRMKMFIKK